MGPTELYLLLSILGLFVFSCVCFSFCCNCFGSRRKRRQAPYYNSSDTCFYCCIMSDSRPVPTSDVHMHNAGTCDANATDVGDAATSNVSHGCCGMCCEDQEGCCDNGDDQSGGQGGFCDWDFGCCNSGDNGDGSGGCCDGGAADGNGGDCCGGGEGDTDCCAGGADAGGGDCCAGGDGGGGDCGGGGGDCDCGGCDC